MRRTTLLDTAPRGETPHCSSRMTILPTDRPTNGIPKLPYPCPPGGTLALPASSSGSKLAGLPPVRDRYQPTKAPCGPSRLLEEGRNLM
ncbi:hypothetical protein KC367_g8 [Hortaea werneckii]|nr:hypothetical protein KC367_g8 [Hortaea werneckii]